MLTCFQRHLRYFGEQLEKAGYNFYGHERMYSGITGEEFDADIFIGVVCVNHPTFLRGCI